MFRELPDLCASECASDLPKLLTLWDAVPHLRCICSTKDAGGSTYYRLDQHKVCIAGLSGSMRAVAVLMPVLHFDCF